MERGILNQKTQTALASSVLQIPPGGMITDTSNSLSTQGACGFSSKIGSNSFRSIFFEGEILKITFIPPKICLAFLPHEPPLMNIPAQSFNVVHVLYMAVTDQQSRL